MLRIKIISMLVGSVVIATGAVSIPAKQELHDHAPALPAMSETTLHMDKLLYALKVQCRARVKMANDVVNKELDAKALDYVKRDGSITSLTLKMLCGALAHNDIERASKN